MRILIIPHIGETLGHVVRAIAIADELRLRGASVSFALAPRGVRFIQMQRMAYPTHVVNWGWSHNSFNLENQSSALLEHTLQTVRELIEALDQIRPDLVIGMPGLASTQAARYLQIPHVSVLHGPYLAPLLDLPAPTPPERRIVELARKMCYGPMNSCFSAASRTFGLPALDYDAFVQSEWLFVPQPGLPLPNWPNIWRTQFVRASFGPDLLQSEYSGVPGTCYVTFGSGNPCDITELVALVASVFQSIIVTTGDRVLARSIPNVVAQPYIASASLAGKVTAVVNHGGLGTVGTFAEYHTPQLIVPTELDQAMTALAAFRLGIAAHFGLDVWEYRPPTGRRLPPLDRAAFTASLIALRDAPHSTTSYGGGGAAEIADALLSNEIFRKPIPRLELALALGR